MATGNCGHRPGCRGGPDCDGHPLKLLIPCPLRAKLDALVQTGLYGFGVDQAALRLVESGLEIISLAAATAGEPKP